MPWSEALSPRYTNVGLLLDETSVWRIYSRNKDKYAFSREVNLNIIMRRSFIAIRHSIYDEFINVSGIGVSQVLT